MKEYQRKYRPKTLDEVVGQPEAVSAIQSAVKKKSIPHATLFTGPPGTGKTTIARCLARMTGCKGSDLIEVNAASARGIDTVRDIESRYRGKPLAGKTRVWILDEAHQLSRRAGGDAQTALLKMLEEPPAHVYFFLCTTHPQALLPAIRSRCTAYRLRPIPPKDMTALLKSVVVKEKVGVSDEVIRKIVNACDGAARDALKMLDTVSGIEGEDEQLNSIQRQEYEAETIELCRVLINPRSKWPDVTKVLAGLDEEPETVRRMILGYFSKVALGSGAVVERAVRVLDIFSVNYFDSGRAGLISNCFEVIHAGR